MVELSSCFLKGSLPATAFPRAWRVCRSEPGLHISSFLPQNSLEKSSCCSPAREDLPCNLALPDSQSHPPLLSHMDFALPFSKRLRSSQRCWYIQGGGSRWAGSAASPSSGRDRGLARRGTHGHSAGISVLQLLLLATESFRAIRPKHLNDHAAE